MGVDKWIVAFVAQDASEEIAMGFVKESTNTCGSSSESAHRNK